MVAYRNLWSFADFLLPEAAELSASLIHICSFTVWTFGCCVHIWSFVLDSTLVGSQSVMCKLCMHVNSVMYCQRDLPIIADNSRRLLVSRRLLLTILVFHAFLRYHRFLYVSLRGFQHCLDISRHQTLYIRCMFCQWSPMATVSAACTDRCHLHLRVMSTLSTCELCRLLVLLLVRRQVQKVGTRRWYFIEQP